MALAPNPTTRDLLRALSATDTSTPNFFSVNAAGEPTAEFEGKLVANGLSLQEQGVTEEPPLPINSIEWLRNAIARERIYGKATSENEFHNLILEALGNFAKSKITLKGSDFAENPSTATITLGSLVKLILNSEGKSDFLQLAAPQQLAMNGGRALAAFGGVPSTTSGEVTVSHGLGRTPIVIMLFPNAAAPGVVLGAVAPDANKNTVNFKFTATSNIGVTGNQPIEWLAFG